MRIRSLSVACALLLMTAVSSSAQTFPLDTVPTGATPFGVVVQASEMEGRKALRIELSEQTLRAGFGRGGYGDDPDGHFKFLHPWPGQIPPGQDGEECLSVG